MYAYKKTFTVIKYRWDRSASIDVNNVPYDTLSGVMFKLLQNMILYYIW